ncbi:hypothetical protein [Paenibacillus alvei]|uniref:hypothetical protein n=1 Tax=Paenibacillus alvei TaxID=44250 RepID=UPI0013DA3EAD|nr:hypothetical protein [Paenibacillus alvei]NEZ44995.1 hypothetical protein [Paenibacillus alvei]
MRSPQDFEFHYPPNPPLQELLEERLEELYPLDLPPMPPTDEDLDLEDPNDELLRLEELL